VLTQRLGGEKEGGREREREHHRDHEILM
jgi:hypothetical protein